MIFCHKCVNIQKEKERSMNNFKRVLSKFVVAVMFVLSMNVSPFDGTIVDTNNKVYAAEAESNENFKYVWDSMEAYRETMNVYRDWLGDYSFGYNRADADLSGANGSTERHDY